MSGNATKAEVRPILRNEIAPTLKHFAKILGVKPKQLRLIGSAGKMDQSGDIDLAVTDEEYAAYNATILNTTPNILSVFNFGTQIGSYPIPICGDAALGYCQIDLMVSHHIPWTEFSYFSPGDSSKYKGVVRTALLMGVAAAKNVQGVDHFEYDDDGGLLVRSGRTFDLARGLRHIFQYRPLRKDGKGYTKVLQTITKEQFIALFPNVDVQNTRDILDPGEAVCELFGFGVEPSDVECAEQILGIIKTMSPKKQQRIIDFALTRIPKDISLPPEMWSNEGIREGG